ncbi:MAG TPA: DUF748 domain-containing protein [Methylophilaceae bacterium]|nr:DUF748 domain-containing protein [Methylophilaceae bacterium]
MNLSSLKPRIRSFLVSRPLKIVLGILLAYLLLGYFAVNPLAQRLLPWVAENKLASRITVDSVKFDPLRLIVRVDQLKLRKPDGMLLAGFDHLQVDLDTAGIFRFAWRLSDIHLSGPQVVLDIAPDGSFNWAQLIARLNEEKPEEDASMARLLIDHIQIENGHVQYSERDRPTPFHMALKPLGIELEGLSTLPEDRGDYLIAAKLPEQGGALKWKGDIALNPIASRGTLELQDIKLAKLLQVVDPASMPVKVTGGGLQTRFAYDFSMTGDKAAPNPVEPTPKAKLSDIAIQLNGLAADLDPQRKLALQELSLKVPTLDFAMNKGTQLAFSDLEVSAKQIVFSDAGFVRPLRAEIADLGLGFGFEMLGDTKAIHAAKLDLGDMRLYSGDGAQPIAGLAKVAARNGEVDLGASAAQLASVVLSGLTTDVIRNADGKLNWQQILEAKAADHGAGQVSAAERAPSAASSSSSSSAPSPPDASADSGTAPWTLALGQLALEDGGIRFVDNSTREPVTLDIQKLSLAMAQISQDPSKPLPVKASFKVKQGGQFSADGKLALQPFKSDMQLKLQALSLKPFTPYVNQAAYLKLNDGQASLQGKLALKTGTSLQGDFRGGFSIDHLAVNEEQGGATFLAWKTLASDSLKLDIGQPRLHMDALRIVEPVGKFIIYEDRTLNVKRILRASEPAAKTAASPQPSAAESPAFAVSVDRISIDNASLEFADLSLKPQFGTNMHNLGGVINGLSTSPDSTAQVELDGKVDEFGSARIRGSVQPFRATEFTDLKLAFQNLEMNRLTPYSGKFAGRRIDSGKLSVDLEYKIKQRQLAGENKFVINKLRLGERVESPDAANLPLDLAIAILEDKDGLIDLDLPVTGNLDDPQFSYGKIIWKAVVNVIGKIVTSPFRALGKLLGISSDKLEAIVFEPGKATLAPQEQEKLKAIGSILEKRPALALKVSPTVDLAADLAALQEQVTRRDVLNEMGVKLADNEQPGPIDLNNPRVQVAIESLLNARQGKGGGLKAINKLKAYFKKADPEAVPRYAEMLDQLKLTAKVSEADVTALGKARIEAMQRYLTESAGVPAGRVSLGEASKVQGDGKAVAIKMELGVGQ